MNALATENTKDSKSWPQVKLGDLGTITRGNGIKRSETRERGYPCLRYGEIYTSYDFVLDRPRSFVSKEVFDGSLHIKKNDLVFTLTGETEDEIAKTLAYLGDEEIAAGGDLAVWKDHGCDPKYLAYLMYSPELIRAKSLASNGQIIVHISVKKFQQIEIPLPPLAVQHEIVARLEKDLAMVERMAKGFEALKAEADQLFRSTLKETFEEVSRGGAETRRLGDLCETGAGGTPLKQHKEYYESGTIPWLRSGEVCTRDIHSTELCITQLGVDNSSAKLFPTNSVVVAMYGATAGQVGILRMASTTNQAVCAIFPAGFYEPEYLYYQLVDKKADMVAQAQGGAQPNISQIKIRNLEVCFPSLPTQRKIVAKLDAVRERCEKLKRAAEEGLQAAALMRKAILKEAFA